jgi:hypothetical protein
MKKNVTLTVAAIIAIIATILLIHKLTTRSLGMRNILLEQIPKLSASVLEQQEKQVRIGNPVLCLSEDETYWFSVEVLPSKRFPEAELYEFAGDASRLEHFVREIQFVNADKAGVGGVAMEVGDGAVDDVKEITASLWNLIRHPIDLGKNLGKGLWALAGYVGDLVQGKKDVVEDFNEFWAAYKENAKTRIAAENGLNYHEIMSVQALRDIGLIAKSSTAGKAAVEVATLLLAWTKIGKAGKAAEITQAATKAEQTAKKAVKLTKVGKAGSLFEMAAKAEQAAARTEKYAAMVQKMPNLEKLANLLNPAKINTLSSQRILNQRLNKVMYWLRQEELAGHNPADALTRAMKLAGADSKQLPGMLSSKVDYNQLMVNYNKLKDGSVFNDVTSMDRIRRGNPPIMGGKALEVDHVIPVSKNPAFMNAWGNLSYEYKEMNRAKGGRMLESTVAKAKEYFGEGKLTQVEVTEIVKAVAP